MTRKKVKLAFIANDTARKATYKKRKKGLMKKVSELSTLCGIDACAIMFSPYEAQPEIWPSPPGVLDVISKFREMPELEQSKKMMNQEGFLKQRVSKTQEQIQKACEENNRKEVTQLMFQYLAAEKDLQNVRNMVLLRQLTSVLDNNLREITMRMEALKMESQGQSHGQASNMVPQPENVAVKAKVEQDEELNVNAGNTMQRQQWQMNMMDRNGGGNGMVMPMPVQNFNHQKAAFYNNPFFKGNGM
ncbi:hypothetical protein L6164_017860 [Bauhinia variegata]|uniref:Uncharacterized protein n=1 Tax=Bauhinia variegata TaxID=167791 RepID=A0ACB9NAS1_BAUVA|nr:hypothetical protein L6164_017860 [Bauhinia variegata]